ncbi:MAG: hypothetical protein KGJ13_04240 [Patescibacteria group bacterium]|nr:hypothetical protein [Patescibacteria group bacterium]
MAKTNKKPEINLGENLKKLAKIAEWLEEQEQSDEPDFDEGLAKVREAVEIIKASRERLVDVENEFEEIKRDIEKDIKGDEEV